MNSADLIHQCRAAIAAGHARMPVPREVILDGDTAVTAFAKLHRGGHGFLLESLEGGERWARYTFMATEPSAVHRYYGNEVQSLGTDGEWSAPASSSSPLEHLASLMRSTTSPAAPGLPRFTGGAVGFWGYDVVRSIEKLPDPPHDDQQLPDAVVMMIDNLVVLDHLHHRAIVITNIALDGDPADDELARRIGVADATAEEWIDRLSQPVEMLPLRLSSDQPASNPAGLASPFGSQEFMAGVERCQEYISAGDAFQIVLSRRIDLPGSPDPYLTYRWLRSLNPAPYCYYLHLDQLTLVGASPEVLVRVEDRTVTVRPIAGTRPRGTDEAHDLEMERELLADPKERAEHQMLVDLGRNDVGRVAEWGSVEVVASMVVERYSRVMHLVSEVRGRLRSGLDSLDALAAAFPAGTVSGAPKVRAMQIIDELEPTRRGPYAGAVGYVGYGATNLDTAIAIRTVVFNQGRASVQAGAGIVADSVPEMELRETEAKAAALLKALQLSKPVLIPRIR